MKIIALGDTHGRKNWEQIVEQEKDADKIVFVGDYFDTHENTTGAEQMANFKKLTELKRAHSDQVVLLLGNHELHYILPLGERYSGFQDALQWKFEELIVEALAEDWVQTCYLGDNILFSHAGFTETWRKANSVPLNGITEVVNKMKLQSFIYNREDRSGFGESIVQGPLWVRPESLLSDPCSAYRQVVGHTTMKEIAVINPICFIDTIGTSGQYLCLTDGEPLIKKQP